MLIVKKQCNKLNDGMFIHIRNNIISILVFNEYNNLFKNIKYRYKTYLYVILIKK